MPDFPIFIVYLVIAGLIGWVILEGYISFKNGGLD